MGGAGVVLPRRLGGLPARLRARRRRARRAWAVADLRVLDALAGRGPGPRGARRPGGVGMAVDAALSRLDAAETARAAACGDDALDLAGAALEPLRRAGFAREIARAESLLG